MVTAIAARTNASGPAFSSVNLGWLLSGSGSEVEGTRGALLMMAAAAAPPKSAPLKKVPDVRVWDVVFGAMGAHC